MKIAAAVFCLLFAGCATTPIPISEATPVPPDRHVAFKKSSSTTAAAVIRRDSGLQASVCSTQVFVNGALAAYIRSGEIVTLHIPSGEVILGAMADSICAGALVELRASLPANTSRHFRIGYDTNGAIGLYPTATR